jgi:hypothetical protein
MSKTCRVLFIFVNINIATASKGFDRHALGHISRHGLPTAMQHQVETGKVFRGLSN